MLHWQTGMTPSHSCGGFLLPGFHHPEVFATTTMVPSRKPYDEYISEREISTTSISARTSSLITLIMIDGCYYDMCGLLEDISPSNFPEKPFRNK
jgi:hypothetical protein